MKIKSFFLSSVALLLAAVCGNLSAQSASTVKPSAESDPQSVINTLVTNPNILVLTGKITDAQTRKPIENAKINFDKFGLELLQASIDKNGNYALALNKEELGTPIRVIFKVNGYKKYVVKSLNKNANYADIDIQLQPIESEERSAGNVTYKMDDDPFNPLVIKMQ